MPLIARSSYVMKKVRGPSLNITFRTALPFAASIDWERASLRYHPARGCTSKDAGWLTDNWLNNQSSSRLEAKRSYASSAFDAYLDVRKNPRGVAEALLREIQESGAIASIS